MFDRGTFDSQTFDEIGVPVVGPLFPAWLGQPTVKDRKSLAPSFFADPWSLTQPADIGWHGWLSDPVRSRPGLKASLQQFYAAPSRIIPTPDVSVTMDAVESANDFFLAGIEVTTPNPIPSQEGASVVITEITVLTDGAISIREP